MSESIWNITISVFPHSTGRGAEEDQKSVGGTIQRFTVDAVEIGDAFELAKAIRQGIESNPMVWVTKILGVVRVDVVCEGTP